MNLDLKLKHEVWEAFISGELVEVTNSPVRPLLRHVLKNIGPLPEEALLLGIADDGLPVLLNLWDPTPGPLLIAGDSKSGKTDFLKIITSFVASTHEPDEIQYGVITARPHEWDGYVNHPHCIGIFALQDTGPTDFIRALVAWIKMNRNTHQSILLLVDELADVLYWKPELDRELRKIMLCGPERKVWPVVTVNLESIQAVEAWLGYFHTRIFGHTNGRSSIDSNDTQHAGFGNLSRGIEFSLRENSHWTKFRIPKL